MAQLFWLPSPLGHRHPLQKRHPGLFDVRRFLLPAIFFVLLLAYYVMIPDQIFSHLFGRSKGLSSQSSSSSGVHIEDSRVRIERIAPEKWTTEDVGVWLGKEGFGRLRTTFRKHKITGPALLALDQHKLMREMGISDDDDVKHLLQALRLLKHIAFQSHSSWKAAFAGRAPASDIGGGARTVALYAVGDNIFYDKEKQKLVPEGLPPAATVSLQGARRYHDVVARASQILKKPVRELVAANGDLIADLEELPERVFALFEDDFYVFPTEHVGYVQQVPLPSSGRWRKGMSMDELTAAPHLQPPKTVTVETLSTSPRVFLVKDFIGKEECEHIIQMAADKMDRSTIAEAGTTEAKNGVGTSRTSSTAWLTKSLDPLVADIRERVADLVKVPMHLAEDMQVLHYAKLEHYWAHHDYFDPNIYRAFVSSPGQNRFITVFFYLSDVEEGGETVFPFANGDDRRVTDFADCSRGLRVRPSAGNAIVFYSLLADKQQMVCPEDNLGCNLDVRSLHGGCDVIRGDKWAANYWIANKF